MKKTLLLFALTLNLILAQEDKYMAVTFDDLPMQHQGKYTIEEQIEINKKLLSHIKNYNVPAMGFVNEIKLYTDGNLDSLKVGILKTWYEAGLGLGNHTFSHPNINEVSYDEYKKDLLKGAEVTSYLADKYNKKYEYFRHPYLRAGSTPEIKKALEEFLKEHNYKVAPVTVDNSEWIFAYAYAIAKDSNHVDMMKKIGEEYVTYMIDKVKYYEDQSEKLFGRNIKHVLLLHSNLLNSDYFDDIAQAIQDEGYKFISLDEALEDEAYLSEDEFVGRFGPSWIHRWAITQKVVRAFFEGEPRTPKYVMEYAGIDYE